MRPNHPLLRIANGLSGGKLKSLDEAVELYGQMAFTAKEGNEQLEERIAELELALDDSGYERMGGGYDRQLTKASIDKIADMARVYWLKNPLTKRSTAVQANYVFGKGVDVNAADPDVQAVIDAFWDDSKNRAELTGEQAMLTKETELQVYANLFVVFFSDPLNGATRVRTLPLQEVTRIVSNPEDSREPWYYLREWEQPKEPGSDALEQRKAYYPDLNYMPRGGFPKTFNGIPVIADNPVYHVKVNALSDMDFGVSELYAAIDWAKAYKEFLEDWYAIVKSLSRFAWKATSKSGAKGLGAAKAQLERAANPSDPDLPGQAAQVWMSSDNLDLSPMPKSGATVSVDDGRRALLMVCAATGIYEHYFGDPSTGNLATATAMEQPMLLMFQERQQLWKDVFTTVLNHVIDQAALKPAGKLHGVITWNDYGEAVVDTGDLDRRFEVKFPPILQEDVNQRVDAIVKSVTLSGGQPAGTIDLKTATTQLLTALGEPTDIVDTLFPDGPKSWADVDAEKMQKALQIAQGQAGAKSDDDSDDGQNDDKNDDPNDDGKAAGEEEEAYIRVLDRMVAELRERGV